MHQYSKTSRDLSLPKFVQVQSAKKTMEIIEGFQRNKYVFFDKEENQLYLKRNTLGVDSYFKCWSDNKHSNCKGSCKVDNLGVKTNIAAHNHSPVRPNKVDLLRFLALLRHLCATTTDEYKDIFSLCQRKHEDGALIAGSLSANKTIMRGARREVTTKFPRSLVEFSNMMKKQE